MGAFFNCKHEHVMYIAVGWCNKSSTDACPLNAALYIETGDITSEPLLCHYPVKVHMHTNEQQSRAEEIQNFE